MPILLTIALLLLTGASVALGVYWAVVLWHIARTMRTIPTLRDGLSLAPAPDLLKPSAPKVCVIVPAHNEQDVVGKLAGSLVKQTYPNLSVVFALDRCTDGTGAEIRHATGGADHVELLEIRDCPPDWSGKVNAVWQAVRQSKAAREADLLIFTDADTEFDPECVRAAVALLRHRDLGMLSIISRLTCERTFERIAQPAAGMELMRQYPLARANAPTHKRAFANGQFMLFTRGAYEQLGGHAAVKDAVLEDIELARLAERRAVRAGLFFADNLLRCRMYGRFEEFVDGWKRIYVEAANRRVKRLEAIAWRTRLLGTFLPLLACAGVGLGLVAASRWPTSGFGPAAAISGGIALLLMLGALIWSYRISQVPLWFVPLYPIGAWQIGAILKDAAADLRAGVPVRWGGREYIREAR